MNFSTANNMCMCVNYAADIIWKMGRLNLNLIKCIYFTIHYAGGCYVRNCVDVVNAFLHRVSMNPDETLHNQWCSTFLTCLATDACLTADPGVASSILVRSHTFVKIDLYLIIFSFHLT